LFPTTFELYNEGIAKGTDVAPFLKRSGLADDVVVDLDTRNSVLSFPLQMYLSVLHVSCLFALLCSACLSACSQYVLYVSVLLSALRCDLLTRWYSQLGKVWALSGNV
jgi:hypothetical protein